MITIAYMTNRREPMIEWFFDSLANDLARREHWEDIQVVIVDFYHAEFGRTDEIKRKSRKLAALGVTTLHIPPKPTPWQGPYRLTKEDYFAAANARNTAACYAPDGYIVYIDDLSVILPGWLARIDHGIAQNWIVCGSYRKVFELEVQAGTVVSFKDEKIGLDSRLTWIQTHVPGYDLSPYPAFDGWSFGCSIAIPIDALLQINGWDEDCDSMGAEDYPLGHMLTKNGYKLMYDPKMLTYESEEHHTKGISFSRKQKLNVRGYPDGAHAYLNMLRGGRDRAPNYFGEGGLAALRKSILSGGQFSVSPLPQNDWRDGQPLSEM